MAEEVKKETAQEGRTCEECQRALARLVADVRAIREATEKACQQVSVVAQVFAAAVEGVYQERWAGKLLFLKDNF